MGDATINPKALEDAMLKALPTLFPQLAGTTSNPRAEFYNDFQREAEQHDQDFLGKYGGDLDTTLIFAGLFSAVTSAFIVDVRTQIQTDYTQLTYDVTAAMANVNLGRIAASDAVIPQPNGPDPTLVRVQAILFSSLVVSLLAAFVAMLGKQWLNRYSQVDMHGSLIDRSRDRQRKMDGMTAWKFSFVMESLPLLLQASLLLLGCALTAYFHTIDNVDPWVIAGFTSAGFVFYVSIVIAGSLSYDCPFQTPISLFVHILTGLNDKRKRRKRDKAQEGWFSRIFSRKKKQRPQPGKASRLNSFSTFDGTNPDDHIELGITGPYDNSLFEKEIDWEGYTLDSNCIEWMFERSMDEEVILGIMGFIPEVVWHDNIQATPLKRLYDTLLECFDRSSGPPVLIPKLTKKAYLSAKALLHVAIHRKCIDNESDKAIFQSISRTYQIMGTQTQAYEGNSDLESTLCVLDRVLKDESLGPMSWDKFSFSDPHRAWMGHILVYRAWYVLKKSGPLPDDIKGFVLHSLRTVPPPPTPVISDCLRIIGSVIGVNWDPRSQHITDPNRRLNYQIGVIYQKLVHTFGEPNPTHHDIVSALETMKLIAPLSISNITTKSYFLFHIVMKAPTSHAYPEESKWEAARLALHGAYKWDQVLPWVDDPEDILTFLGHHFELEAKDKKQDEPIQNALRALAYASNDLTIECINRLNTTEPSFVRGVCSAFQSNRPPQMRKAALFLLPLIGDRWFNVPHPIMEDDAMEALCTDWYSAVEENKPAENLRIQRIALTVLFHMMNSTHWRRHISNDIWRLLEYFTSVPEDSESLRRCLNNPQLTPEISDSDGIVLWSTILWLRYKELITEVQQQLVGITRSAQRRNIDMYTRTLDEQSIKAEDRLTEFTTWSTDSEAVSLRARIESIREAKTVLNGIRRG